MAQFGAHSEDEDPSVCYRHPDRQSWVLCQRCGRTICFECQIPAAVGVQCPECVREAGGTVPRSSRSARVTPISAARGRTGRSRERSGWQQAVLRMLRPGSGVPVLSWGFVALSLVVWIVGFFTPVLENLLAINEPGSSIQVWRFLTTALVSGSSLNFWGIFFKLLSLVFFLLVAPAAEMLLGRARFAAVALASAAVGSAAMVLSFGFAFGQSALLFGLFSALLVLQWDYPQARIQWLIWMAANFVLSISLPGGAVWLPYLIGGGLAGVGATLLLRRFENSARSKPSTPYLIIAGGAAAFIVLAILRSLA